MDQQQPAAPVEGFKPNIYPVMYWALAYGVIAGAILFVVYLLSRYITIVWFPVFLAGVVWGGYRNYKKQKNFWHTSQGMPPVKKSAMDEFKEAVGDIVSASQEMMAEQAQEQEQPTETGALPADEAGQSEAGNDDSQQAPPAGSQPQ